jgi:hypothetical protein
LLGRYNQTKAQYDLFPDTEAPTIGHGYVLRLGGALGGYSVDGRWWPHMPMSVALKPGWNMVSSPLPESVPTTNVEVIRSTGVPLSFAAAQGGTESDLGIDFFSFVPGANDPASGVPETGSLVPATSFDPGKAYYVRVLAPEGVTLLFLPSSPLLGPYVKPDATNRVTGNGWDLRLEFNGNGRTVSAHIGASSTATSRFDGKEDSGMPPGIGGFQATVIDSQPLFRDIRELGQDHTYTVRLDGLVKGLSYRLNPVLTKGAVFRIGLTDTGNPNAPFLRLGQSYSFVASGPSRVLKLTVRGNGR